MKFLTNGDWGLKILALVLALVIYHSLKTDKHNKSIGFPNDRQHITP